ncbi:metabolite traffic protein EboE [Nonomuraea angiospora]|uniref:metabolite traffic protein EboE n=1 Tax=Nonomuraea angiospora TaxID=46172 RepID=UPI003414436A
MRFRHADGTVVHLAYCTNVHPAEDLEGVFRQLARFAAPVRELLGTRLLGLGLWLAHGVAAELRADPAQADRLAGELARHGLEVVTLNGFPYGGFQREVVKKAVYRPDWAEPARLRYTADLAWTLARLLPPDARAGSVSTLPLCWRDRWNDDWWRLAREQLGELRAELARVERETGRTIRLAFEPEPGCVVETTEQAVEHLAGLDPGRYGLSLDTCHLAVAHEDPAAAVARTRSAGLPVVKLQASVALEAPVPADPETRRALAAFAEPRFLHQTRERGGGGTDDLDEAPARLPGTRPWRTHFHVPLHADVPAPLRSTREVLQGTLEQVFGGPAALTDHVEVETYTWDVLPSELRPRDDAGLVRGIAAELAWMREALLATGLKEIA